MWLLRVDRTQSLGVLCKWTRPSSSQMRQDSRLIQACYPRGIPTTIANGVTLSIIPSSINTREGPPWLQETYSPLSNLSLPLNLSQPSTQGRRRWSWRRRLWSPRHLLSGRGDAPDPSKHLGKRNWVWDPQLVGIVRFCSTGHRRNLRFSVRLRPPPPTSASIPIGSRWARASIAPFSLPRMHPSTV
jgi:hypothetical protein